MNVKDSILAAGVMLLKDKGIAALTQPQVARAAGITLADTFAEVMIGGVPPRVMIGLIVAADADPAIRKPLRKLIKHVRTQVQVMLATSGLASGPEAVLLFHATVVGLAIMHQARLNPQSAREVREGIAAMLGLLAPPIEQAKGRKP